MLYNHMLQSLRRGIPKTTFRFASEKENSNQHVLQDWEYCKQITQSLKNKDIDASLSHLFQSYFNGQVLDRQIYNSVLSGISQQNLPLSYSQITYTIFRQHFPAHPLMLNWMNKLSASTDDTFLDKLKLDFDALNHPFPKKSRRTDKSNPSIREVEEHSRSRKSRLGRSNETESNQNNSTDPPEVQFLDPNNITPEQLVKLRIEADLRNALGQINSGVSNFGKINLYDVEIEFNENDGQNMDNQIYDDQGQDQDDMMSPEMGFMGLDISKIKIGRVEFLANQDDDKKDD